MDARRHFQFTVENGAGARVVIPIEMDDAARPDDFRLKAIGAARRTVALFDVKPFRVVAMEEV